MQKFGYSKKYFIYGVLILLIEIILVFYLEAWYLKALLLILAGYSTYGLIKDYYSYFVIDEQKITYTRFRTYAEIGWADIDKIGISQKWRLFQMIIYSNDGKVFVVTFWFENYKELVNYIMDKCKANPDIQVDGKLLTD